MRSFIAEGRVAAATMVREGNSGPFGTAASFPMLTEPFPDAAHAPSPPGPVDTEERSLANFVVVADLRSANSVAFEAALNRIGLNYRVNPNVWLLQSKLTPGSIRNDVAPLLGASDHILVIDTAHSKIAWANFGPQADAQLRAIWIKAATK